MSDFFVHPTSVIDDNVSIGSGTKIWYFCHVQSGTFYVCRTCGRKYCMTESGLKEV